MTTHQLPLVGAHFRQGGKTILEHLPAGCRLTLAREADNPYDGNALRVMLDCHEIPVSQWDELELKLQAYGLTMEALLAEPYHLGYIAANPPKRRSSEGLQFNSWLTPIWDSLDEVGQLALLPRLAFHPADNEPVVEVDYE